MRIKKDKLYSLQNLVEMNAFPWIKSFSGYRRIVAQDRANLNLLNPNIMGEKFGKRYWFRGENVLKFKKKVETGGYHFK